MLVVAWWAVAYFVVGRAGGRNNDERGLQSSERSIEVLVVNAAGFGSEWFGLLHRESQARLACVRHSGVLAFTSVSSKI